MNLEHKIKKPTNFVFDHLTDMQKFVSVHPIIYKMDDLSNGNYKVYEKLGLVSFTYSANVNGDPQNKIVNIKAVVMKMTHIEMIFKLKSAGDHTLIEETVNFRSPLPIKTLMQNIFRKQHKQLFFNIENSNH
jgi:hypothetical protein